MHAENFATLLDAQKQRATQSNGCTRWVFLSGLGLRLPLHYQKDCNSQAQFFTKLETLTAYLHPTQNNANKRIERYGVVIKEINDYSKILHLILKS